jgi:hypothetical protein
MEKRQVAAETAAAAFGVFPCIRNPKKKAAIDDRGFFLGVPARIPAAAQESSAAVKNSAWFPRLSPPTAKPIK